MRAPAGMIWSVVILSPTLTFSSVTIPDTGEGMSIVALSDSSVISESSALTVSPALTSSSMIGTSLKSPRSGTLTSTTAAGAAAADAAGAEHDRCLAHLGTTLTGSVEANRQRLHQCAFQRANVVRQSEAQVGRMSDVFLERAINRWCGEEDDIRAEIVFA